MMVVNHTQVLQLTDDSPGKQSHNPFNALLRKTLVAGLYRTLQDMSARQKKASDEIKKSIEGN